MRTVQVKTSSPYEVRIGTALTGEAGQAFGELFAPCKVCLLTDDMVDALYAPIVEKSLQQAGFQVYTYTISHGEASKCGPVYLSLLNFLADNGFSRTDVLAALGGGVVGDLGGFTAATYLRGIRYVQLPTTVLAMVDSSVGGKTAIDLPAGKNLCGAFWQPALVLCSTDTADTLPREIFADGMAEVIKYGVIRDESLFRHLQENGTSFDRDYVISRCVEIKRDIVEADEFDNGERQLLNFGHTVAHAVEKLSGYALSHGRAVAMGMAVMGRCAAREGLWSQEEAQALCRLTEAFGLPTQCPYSPAQMAQVLLSDKKRRGGTITLVLPRRLGQAELCPTPVEACEALLAKGVEG